MPMLAITDLLPGMRAGEDVQGPGGRVFLRRGDVITERHLLALRALGIAAISARNDDHESHRAPTPSALLANLQQELLPRFRHNDLSHPAVKEVFRLALLRMAKARMG
ncbi:MAG: hypothetical protein RLZZ127_2570 [Planctomycetota bacterium]|jgi:hypothetical protein